MLSGSSRSVGVCSEVGRRAQLEKESIGLELESWPATFDLSAVFDAGEVDLSVGEDLPRDEKPAISDGGIRLGHGVRMGADDLNAVHRRARLWKPTSTGPSQ